MSDRLVIPVRWLLSPVPAAGWLDRLADDAVIVLVDAEGTARDGVPYRNTYSWYLTLHDDRIVKATAFFDSITFDDFWRRVTPAPQS